MLRENANDLLAFLAVARERSFTKAAGKLGVSQSALSDLRDTPAGNIRINAMDHALEYILWPVLKPFLAKYPDISVEVCCDYGFVDIAAQGFDAGVRLGEDVAQGMIATRIGPDMRMAVVGSPTYFAERTQPKTPRDLTDHQCNNLRLPTNGGLYAWEFKKGDESLKARVSGQVTFNGVYQLLTAALDGFGLSYLPEDLVAPHLATGRLVQVLEDWCAPFAGFHLYYPSRRQASPAFALLLEALRYRG